MVVSEVLVVSVTQQTLTNHGALAPALVPGLYETRTRLWVDNVDCSPVVAETRRSRADPPARLATGLGAVRW